MFVQTVFESAFSFSYTSKTAKAWTGPACLKAGSYERSNQPKQQIIKAREVKGKRDEL